MAKKAFLIGANTFGLSFANNDVMLLNEALQKHDYEIIIPSLSKSDILTKFDSFVDDCKKNDTIIFYFSGHGFTPKGSLQLVIGEELTKNKDQISIDYITGLIEECKAENKLIILDCCQANAITNNWNPSQSERYRILTASEKLEKGKEIDAFKASFLTFYIHKALYNSETIFNHKETISINDIYIWLSEQTEIFNSQNNSIKVPFPNLLGNQKINFPLALNKYTIINNSQSDSNSQPLTQIKTMRYIRERCRIYIKGSDKFNEVMESLISNKYTKKELDNYKREIISFTTKYESHMALAAYHEKKGKIEMMLDILNVNLRGQEESSRLLYRALVLEKLDRIPEAINDLYSILLNEHNIELVKAAQFNLNVCYEKKNDYAKVDFTKFFIYKDMFFAGNERLSDKAITMHLIVCHKTNQEFLYDLELMDVFQFQAKNNPIGYTKTLLIYFLLQRKKISRDEIYNIYKLTDNMSINNKVAVLSKLLPQFDKETDVDVIMKIIHDLKDEYEVSKSYTLSKFIDETLLNLKQ